MIKQQQQQQQQQAADEGGVSLTGKKRTRAKLPLPSTRGSGELPPESKRSKPLSSSSCSKGDNGGKSGGRGGKQQTKQSTTQSNGGRKKGRGKKPRSSRTVVDEVIAKQVAEVVVPSVVNQLKGLRINGSQVTCWVDKRRGNTGKHLTREDVYYWQVQANRRHVFSGWHSPNEVVERVRSVVAEHEALAETAGLSATSSPQGRGRGRKSHQPTPASSPRSSMGPVSRVPPASRPFHSLTFELDADGVPNIEPYLSPLRFGGLPLVVYIHEDKGEHKKRKNVFFWTIAAGETRLLHGWYSARTIVKRMRSACQEGPERYTDGTPLKPRHLGKLYKPGVMDAAGSQGQLHTTSETSPSMTSPPPRAAVFAYPQHGASRAASAHLAAHQLHGHLAAAAAAAAAGTIPTSQWRRPLAAEAMRMSAAASAKAFSRQRAIAYATNYYMAYMADPAVVRVITAPSSAAPSESDDDDDDESELELEPATGIEYYDPLPSYEKEVLASPFWANLSLAITSSTDPNALLNYISEQVTTAVSDCTMCGRKVAVVFDASRGAHPSKRHTYYARVVVNGETLAEGWYHPAALMGLVRAVADKSDASSGAGAVVSTANPANKVPRARALSFDAEPAELELEDAEPAAMVMAESAPPSPSERAPAARPDPRPVALAPGSVSGLLYAELSGATMDQEPLVLTPGTLGSQGRQWWSVSAAGSVIVSGWFTPAMLRNIVCVLADDSPLAFPSADSLDPSVGPHLSMLKRMAAALAGLGFRGNEIVPSVRLSRGAYPYGVGVYLWSVATSSAHVASGWFSLPSLLAKVISTLDTDAALEPNNTVAYFATSLGIDFASIAPGSLTKTTSDLSSALKAALEAAW